MEMPKLDVTALPDLGTMTGVYGSQRHPTRSVGSDDSIIVLMSFLYEIIGDNG